MFYIFNIVQESDPNRKRDVTGFYRDILDKVEQKYSPTDTNIDAKHIMEQIKQEEEISKQEEESMGRSKWMQRYC